MFRFKTVLAVLAFAALPLAANAAGHSVQGPQNYYGGGSTVSSGASLYGPVGVGNMVNSNAMNFAPSGSNSVNVSGLTGTLNVQTNIDNSKTIDSSSNINVTQTVNGSNVAYGLDGAQALNVIDQAGSDDAAVSGQLKTNAQIAVQAGMLAAELMGN